MPESGTFPTWTTTRQWSTSREDSGQTSLRDGVHPNGKGYTVMAPIVRRGIDAALKTE